MKSSLIGVDEVKDALNIPPMTHREDCLNNSECISHSDRDIFCGVCVSE